MTTENMFERATREKIRFATVKGSIAIEMLWDVPLRSKDDFNLDAIAKTANACLKGLTEESFVDTGRTAEQSRAELRLELVKYVIEIRLAEETAAKKRAANREEKQKLLHALAEKQTGALSALTEAELQKRIEALDA